MYEIAIGAVPFGGEESDVFQVYQEILKSELVFPEWFEWENAREVIKHLLNKSPDARLGSSISAFKAHKWFELINWDWVGFFDCQDKLLNKKITPDYLPDSVIEMPSEESSVSVEYLKNQIVVGWCYPGSMQAFDAGEIIQV